MTLLDRLIEAINYSIIGNAFSLNTIMTFILGSELERSGFSTTNLKNLYNGQSLTHENAAKLLSDKNWNSLFLNLTFNGKIDVNILTSEITKIYHDFISDDTTNLDLFFMIKDLVHLHFFGTYETEYLFPPYTPRKCNAYIPWNKMEKIISNDIHSNNIIFITGNAGSGKKLLLTNILKRFKTHYADFYFPNHEFKSTSIENQIRKLTFWSDPENTIDLETKIEYLNNKSNNSVLVIDVPVITGEDYEFLLKNFHNTNLRIIILTRNTDISKKFFSRNIDNMPLENLKEIYRSINPSYDFTDVEFKELCKIVSYNPFIITLVARTLRKEPCLKSIMLDKQKWIWYEKNMPSIHSNYHDSGKKSGNNIISLILRTLDFYPKSSFEEYLSELSIWSRHPIHSSLLASRFTSEQIDTAISYGILHLEETSNSKLYMHPIISDAIWHKYPISHRKYKNIITTFLSTIQLGKPLIIPFQDLYPIIFNLITRYHFQISIMKSRQTKESWRNFVEWNDLLLQVIQLLLNTGNYKMAKELNDCLFYSNNTETSDKRINPEKFFMRDLINLQIKFRDNANAFAYSNELIRLVNIHQATTFDNFNRKYFPFLQTLLDYRIRNERFLSTFHAGNNDETSFVLSVLDTMFPLIQNVDTNIFHYYKSNYYLIKAYHVPSQKERLNNITKARTCLFLLNQKNTNYSNNYDELFIKSLCLELYYDILFYKLNSIKQPTNIQKNITQRLSTSFYELYKIIPNRIYSWETTDLFYECAILLYSFALDPITKIFIEDSIKQYASFIKYQISLSDSEQRDALENILILINHIQNND